MQIRNASDSPAHVPLSEFHSVRALLAGDEVGMRRWVCEPTLTITETRWLSGVETRTGQVYTHMLNRGPAGLRSPVDTL